MPYQEACTIGEHFVRVHPDNLDYQSDLGQLEHKLAMAYEHRGKRPEAPIGISAGDRAPADRRHAGAEGDDLSLGAEQALRPAGRSPSALGQPAEAAATSRERKQLWPGQPAELYQVACELAQCVPLVGKAKTQLTAAEEAERRRYAAEAIQTLRQAVDSGFKEVEQLRTAPELNSLRSHADFQKLQQELEQKGKKSGSITPAARERC